MANGSCLLGLQILGGVMVLALGGAGLYFGMFEYIRGCALYMLKMQ